MFNERAVLVCDISAGGIQFLAQKSRASRRSKAQPS
jgi:hypothetical protein